MIRRVTIPAIPHWIQDLIALGKLIRIDCCAYVETGATRQDRKFPPPVDIRKALSSIRLEKGRGIRLPRVNQVESEVRNAPFANGELARADIHPAVNLHRISAHHLPVETFSQSQGELGLPRGSRPHNTEDRIFKRDRLRKPWLSDSFIQ